MMAVEMLSVASVLPTPAFGQWPTPSEYVYFDFDSSKLTKYGQQVVDHFASETKKIGSTSKILVSCHADRAGKEDYNFALSERRCATVRDALIAAGVAPQLIVLWPRGESAAPVATPDGVKEQGNRFAIVDYCYAFDQRPRSCD
jgi:outer membrane protein OmpA-like peptidoglycan-associated protein